MLEELIEKAAGWIAEQRDIQRPNALPFAPDVSAAMAPFFGHEIMGAARVRIVPSLENPDFFLSFESKYHVVLPDFSIMDGITLGDTILLRDHPIELPLIFHELVHVAQYRFLGILEFARRYVMGWAENGREYINIPLEQNAYELEHRYRREPDKPFTVLGEVKRQLS